MTMSGRDLREATRPQDEVKIKVTQMPLDEGICRLIMTKEEGLFSCAEDANSFIDRLRLFDYMRRVDVITSETGLALSICADEKDVIYVKGTFADFYGIRAHKNNPNCVITLVGEKNQS